MIYVNREKSTAIFTDRVDARDWARDLLVIENPNGYGIFKLVGPAAFVSESGHVCVGVPIPSDRADIGIERWFCRRNIEQALHFMKEHSDWPQGLSIYKIDPQSPLRTMHFPEEQGSHLLGCGQRLGSGK